MLRESLNGTPKAEAKRGRGMVMMVLMGACALALGLAGFSSYEQPVEISDAAMHAHLTTLIDHHAYLKDQNEVLQGLIEEGTEN
jgi:hypothetical protein